MEDTGIRVSLQAYAEVEKAGENTRTALYRIAQEALSNVARHANASRAQVSIVQHEDLIRMEITDDGHGFEVEGTTGASKKGNRLGLLGMRERIEMIGGTFCIESAPGRPTTVRVEVPRSGKAARRFPKKKTASSPTLECS
jgi:signal transduction histidine kinase